jgi:hypothetical protein
VLPYDAESIQTRSLPLSAMWLRVMHLLDSWSPPSSTLEVRIDSCVNGRREMGVERFHTTLESDRLTKMLIQLKKLQTDPGSKQRDVARYEEHD